MMNRPDDLMVDPNNLELDELTNALRESFPCRDDGGPVQILGEGFRSLVVESSDGRVLRVAKHGHTMDRWTVGPTAP